MNDPKSAQKTPGIGRRSFLKAGAAVTAASVLLSQESGAQSLTGAASFGGTPTAPDAPRPWNIPQRAGAPVSIDVHTHWAPEAYMKAKAELGRSDNSDPINFDLDRRMKWMDAHGVQTLVLTLGGFMPWQWASAEQGAHLAQLVNDAAVEAHTAYPNRLIAGIEVPAGDAAGTLKEINRMAGKPGMVAVHLPNSLAGREYLFEPEFAPVLARCEQLQLPILLHPLDGEPNWYAGHRLADAYSGIDPKAPASLFPGLTNSVGQTFEQATTAAKLIVSGALDKYPNLQIVLAHAGGAFPFIVGRLDRGAAGVKLQHPVKDYIRRFYFDSLTFYPLALRYLIDLAGSDRVVLGTDNLFGQKITLDHPHSLIDQLNLSAEDRDLILRGNLKRLFKL